VRLWVEILSSEGFSKAPSYPELLLSGAIVILPDPFGVNISPSVDGKTWIGQRQRYAIIPQREGKFVVPPIEVKVGATVNGEASNPTTLHTEPLELIAIFPPGMQNLTQILSTETVTISETYDRDTADLKVGDAITRVVTVRGENTFALALPVISFDQVQGTRVYPAQSVLNNQTNRGNYSGTRIDAGTYVLEQAGEVILPEIRVSWWNPKSQMAEEVVLPSNEFHVAKNPVFQTAVDLSLEKLNWTERLKQGVTFATNWIWRNIVNISIAMASLYIILIIWRRYSLVMIERWKGWLRRRSMSEAHFFNEFRKACKSNNEIEIRHSFWRWVDRLEPDKNITPTLSQIGLRDTNMWATIYFKQLDQSHYGAGPAIKFDGEKLYQAIKMQRRLLRSRRLEKPQSGLLQLNPRGIES